MTPASFARPPCWIAAAVALAACGPVGAPDSRLGSLGQGIVGGQVDQTDSNVFMLVMTYYTGANGSGTQLGQAGCSGTLVASHSLVTAAHCVDPRPGIAPTGSVSMTIQATNIYDLGMASPQDLIQASAFAYSPNWDPASLTGDIGMVTLATIPNATPKQFNLTDISGLSGSPIRVIGYGITGPNDQTVPTRREVDLTIMPPVTVDHFKVGNGTQGICHGDSGGPSMYAFPDGVERVVGVHSYTDTSACTSGADTRIDAYQSWIQGWVTQHDTLSCGADGFCLAGCSPVDPDCVPIGRGCVTINQCDGRQCINDPQHTSTYCSKSCAVGTDCPSGMDCVGSVCQFHQLPDASPGQACTPGGTWCLSGTSCAGSAGLTTCQFPCTQQSDCPTGFTCALGSNSLGYCKPPPPPPKTIPAMTLLVGAQASSCEAVSSGPLVLLALLWIGARRRMKVRAVWP